MVLLGRVSEIYDQEMQCTDRVEFHSTACYLDGSNQKVTNPAAFDPQYLQSLRENGAGDEIRTHDIHLGKVTLYP